MKKYNKEGGEETGRTFQDIKLSKQEKNLIRKNLLNYIKENPVFSFDVMPDRSNSRFVCPWIPEAQNHVLQLYREKESLRLSIACWLKGSLEAEGGAILVSAPENINLLREELKLHGIDTAKHEKDGRLCIVNSANLMSWFMVDGEPNKIIFSSLINTLIRRVRKACGDPKAEVRITGDMVNTLLYAGKPEAAKKIELYWNQIIDKEGVRRLCFYHLDDLASESYEILPDICMGHGQLLPFDDEAKFAKALIEAMNDVLGEKLSRAVWNKFTGQPAVKSRMSSSQSVLLGLQATRPAAVREILVKLKEAL